MLVSIVSKILWINNPQKLWVNPKFVWLNESRQSWDWKQYKCQMRYAWYQISFQLVLVSFKDLITNTNFLIQQNANLFYFISMVNVIATPHQSIYERISVSCSSCTAAFYNHIFRLRIQLSADFVTKAFTLIIHGRNILNSFLTLWGGESFYSPHYHQYFLTFPKYVQT